jgi:hypothetical protein
MGAILSVILAIALVLAFFVGIGISIASLFCKKKGQMYLVGTLLGVGFICVIVGIIYVGCSRSGGF